jgi:hypothetical protein
MMLPEHVSALKQHDIEKNKIHRPILGEDDLAKIEHTLQTAIKDRVPVELSYYKDGFIKQTICYPQRLDPINKLLIVYDAYGLKERYAFADIMDAQSN